MNILLLASTLDSASITIKNYLTKQPFLKQSNHTFDDQNIYEWNHQNKRILLITIQTKLIHAEKIDEKVQKQINLDKIDLIVFLSKHVSREGTPSFCVHSIGNWDIAEYGGQDKTITQTNAHFIKEFFLAMKSIVPEDYCDVTLEATHHGPFVSCPAVFVEIGSNQQAWLDEQRGEYVGQAVVQTIRQLGKKSYPQAIGFGGGHYGTNFNKILLRTDYAINFICPKHMLEYVDENLISQLITLSGSENVIALLDWKGLGKAKQQIVSLLEKTNLKIERTQKMLNQ